MSIKDDNKNKFEHIDIPLEIKYDDGQPCNHKGCLNHISHPCEGCGRIGAKGIIFNNPKIRKYYG